MTSLRAPLTTTSTRSLAISCLTVGLLLVTGCMRTGESMEMDGSMEMMAEATTFRVHVEDVSTPTTLQTSEGAKPIPLSPVVYAVYSGDNPIFSAGEAARGNGLEEVAEDGMPMKLVQALQGMGNVSQSGAAAVPTGKDMAGPLMPGDAYDFTVEAGPGDRLTLATMYVQSNDLFIATGEDGIALFGSDGRPVSGDMTTQFAVWDAGTEVNEEPGVGPNTKPKQSGPNTGPSESEPVRLIGQANDGYTYPPAARVIRVTLTPVR